MSQFAKVKDHDGLVRDLSSGAIINTNRSEYENYMKARERALGNDLKITQQAEDINNLKQSVSEIKELLQILVQKDNKCQQ
jgi:hypothetical protein